LPHSAKNRIKQYGIYRIRQILAFLVALFPHHPGKKRRMRQFFSDTVLKIAASGKITPILSHNI
jgi:hypothetical protein